MSAVIYQYSDELCNDTGHACSCLQSAIQHLKMSFIQLGLGFLQEYCTWGTPSVTAVIPDIDMHMLATRCTWHGEVYVGYMLQCRDASSMMLLAVFSNVPTEMGQTASARPGGSDAICAQVSKHNYVIVRIYFCHHQLHLV